MGVCVLALAGVCSATSTTFAEAPGTGLNREPSHIARHAELVLPAMLQSLFLARLEARADRAQCIDVTVTQLNSVLRQARTHETALAEGAPEAGRHASVLRLLGARLSELRKQAQQCVAKSGGLAHGQTVVEVQVPVPPAFVL
jgi:hypothetical protein